MENFPFKTLKEVREMEDVGKTVINDEVFTEIARTAMLTVNDVFRQERKGALAELTQMLSGRFAPQISVKKNVSEEGATVPLGSVSFDMKLTLVYGVNIPDAVNRVRQAVITEVEAITGYKVEAIDITVEKLVKPEKAELVGEE